MKNEKPFLACPHCFTAVQPEPEEPKPEAKVEEPTEPEKPNVNEPEVPSVTNCPHHFGYLSKRSSDGKIPESCMMCEKIVQCMLKNMT
jgi:hypothetical protein